MVQYHVQHTAHLFVACPFSTFDWLLSLQYFDQFYVSSYAVIQSFEYAAMEFSKMISLVAIYHIHALIELQISSEHSCSITYVPILEYSLQRSMARGVPISNFVVGLQ